MSRIDSLLSDSATIHSVRMKELSEASGVPIPTIKFYLRERLLPAGDRSHPNQADYSQAHLRRIRLIRALIEVGGLSLATARAVTAVLDLPGQSLHNVLGLAQHAMAPTVIHADRDDFPAARAQRRRPGRPTRLARLARQPRPGRCRRRADHPGRARSARVWRRSLEPYARAAESAARADLAAVAAAGADRRPGRHGRDCRHRHGGRRDADSAPSPNGPGTRFLATTVVGPEHSSSEHCHREQEQSHDH